MSVLGNAEIVVEAGRKEMIGSLVVVPAENRSNIGHVVRNVERGAADVLRLDVAVGDVVRPGGGEPLSPASDRVLLEP